MKTITINASTEYNVIFENGLLKDAGKLCKPILKGNKAYIITDDIVDNLYSSALEKSLKDEGFVVLKYVIKNGEASKNATNFIAILNDMAENRLTRSDTVFALGGGVVGDLAGFCAATYLRGISYIQLPTTLLASVDSSVGGKTAIDLDCGKNLAGAFYQPKLVIFDTDTLLTLPDEIYSDGMAEIIKYAFICDKNILSDINDNKANENVIARCIEIKRDIVAQDEKENSLRKLLNFGHTIGHAVEKCSNYSISHGHAVAIGMSYITNYAQKANLCDKKCYDALMNILEKCNLPKEVSFSPDELYEAACSDKKADGDKISIILPVKTGECIIKSVSFSELKNIIHIAMER